MGKYSLESFMKVDLLVVRPGWHRTPPTSAQLKRVPADALLLTPDETGWLNTAQQLAEAGLQRHWERAPVYVELKETPDTAQLEQLRAWHVYATNLPGILSDDLRLRRVTCPRVLSSRGALPLRLWLDNAGAAPFYGAHSLHVRLSLGTEHHVIPVRAPRDVLMKLGDIVYNEILQLPELPSGNYSLRFAIRDADGRPLVLNTELPETDGWYTLGTVQVDDSPRPGLFTLWDDWYPDGYYPLEDPKEPQTE